MRRKFFNHWILLMFAFTSAKGQDALPKIMARNFGGRIVISWKNEYTLPLSAISIQRSYDSLKNYSTIGSVLNPANKENGYTDAAPPYSRMYYRVFIGFENGTYTYSLPVRAAPDENARPYGGLRYFWQPEPSPLQTIRKDTQTRLTAAPPAREPQPNMVETEKKPAINYVMLNKDQNVALFLPEAEAKNYSLRFFDENGKETFRLNKLKEENLVIEKVNFIHSGWFNYELYENGTMITRDKIFIPKDQKPGTESRRTEY